MSKDYDLNYVSGSPDAWPITADNENGDLFQTGRVRQAPGGSYPNQFFQHQTSIGTSEQRWSSPSNSLQHLVCCDHPLCHDGFTPPADVPYLPTGASSNPPNDTYDHPQYPILGPLSVREELGLRGPALPSLASTGSPHIPYTHEISSYTASYHHRHDAYQVPQQTSHPHITTAVPNMTIPASYNQVPYDQPTQNDMGQRYSAVCVDLSMHSLPHDCHSRTRQYDEAELEIVVPLDKPPAKPKRKKATPAQLVVLNRTYQRTAFPSTAERAQLAMELGMPPRTVQIWFQHRRQRARKQPSHKPISIESPESPRDFVPPDIPHWLLGGHGSPAS